MSGGWWDAPHAESGVLTSETLAACLEAIKNAPTHPCRLGRHVVSASALGRGDKYARCANCYGLVTLAPEETP